MKKLLISLFVVAAVSFTACGGATKTENAETPATETSAAEATEGSVYDQYIALVKKSYELAKKVQGGDMEAATESAKLAEDMAKFMEENAEGMGNFTAEQQAELVKLAEEFTAEATK